MNVLGISFGKPNANDDILVKKVLYGAKEADPNAEIRFINTCNMNIGRCRGCGACSRAIEKGKGDNVCVFKDDFQKVEDQVRWADAIVIGAPVYVLQPVGQFKDFVDRFSCRHDYSAITWVLDKRKTGELPGDPDDFPLAERFKKRTVAYISVGGASTKNWTSMGNATLHLFGFPPMMKVVANYRANSMGTIGNPLLDEKMIADMNAIGHELVDAHSKADEDIKWFGEDGACPVCHCDLITFNGTTHVECPVCGIEGDMEVDGDKVKIVFPKAQQDRARGTFAGLREHTTEIQGFGAICGPKIMANKEFLDKEMAELKKFDIGTVVK